MSQLEQVLASARAPVRGILENALEDRDIAWEAALPLCSSTGDDLHALCRVADHLRAEQAGDVVTYVVNRNINFTNVCVKDCHFCAFSRDLRSQQGYLIDASEVVRRVRQAVDVGATEVCMQAGLAPNVRGQLYLDLLRAVKAECPDVHIHAYSPEEVKYGAGLARLPVREYLTRLAGAGLDSLPGTSAEILDQSLRDQISPGRITVDEWVDVIRTAHELGLPTTATMMFGHVEHHAHRLRHMDLLRSIQRETGGFTEFVPLSFVHDEAPLFAQSTVPGVQPGPTGNDVVRLYAIARVMLGKWIPNLQASWVKEGLRMSAWLLNCGVNDLGGTLINESISTSAGARNGQLMTPANLRRVIRDAGRVPAERNTKYDILRRFDGRAGDDPVEPLDRVTDAEETFGSYDRLTADPRFRYEPAGRRRRTDKIAG